LEPAVFRDKLLPSYQRAHEREREREREAKVRTRVRATLTHVCLLLKKIIDYKQNKKDKMAKPAL
jgi:hypothetical protein